MKLMLCQRLWAVPIAVCAWIFVGSGAGSSQAAERPIRVLIQTGQNNHDWAATTTQLESILRRDGRFTVEVDPHPERFDAATGDRFDVLLSNWNSWGDSGVKEWPAKAREAFLGFVRQGRGLVVVHAGGSSFPDWDDYHNLIGGTWGKETGHGPVHTFEVRLADPTHPITRGIEPFRITDELWHRMALRSPHVLAAAFSDMAKGGSGKEEPVAFTTTFGKGRCFNLVLGHDPRAMEAAGFQILLRRGTEWAARGKVTIPAKASDDSALFRAALDAVEGYRWGEDRTNVMQLESLVAGTGPAGSPALSRELAKRLSSRSATLEARKLFCQQLSLIGTKREIPALAALLSTPELFGEALLALQRIPGAEARRAMIQALDSDSVSQRVSILNSLAARGEPGSVATIARLAKSTDVQVSTAACRALGRIGGKPALDALCSLETRIAEPARLELRRAQISAAQSMASNGQAAHMRAFLSQWLAPGEPVEVRTAALLLDASVPGPETGDHLIQALSGPEEAVQHAALSGLKLGCNRAALLRAVDKLAQLSPETQVALLTALVEVSAQEALPQVLELVRSSTGELRVVAVDTAASLGNGSAVLPLLQALGTSLDDSRRQLIRALSRLPGEGVDAVLQQEFERAGPSLQVVLLDALVARNPKGLSSLLQSALKSDSSPVRTAAAQGLAKVGTLEATPTLLHPLRSAAEPEATAIETALAEIYRRGGDLKSLEVELGQAEPSVKVRLLSVAAMTGGAQGLKLIESEVGSQKEEVALAALRLLAEWPDPSAFQSLSKVASQTKDPRSRTLAFRGMLRLASQAKENPKEVATAIAQLLPGTSVAERRILLSALGEVPQGAGFPALTDFLSDGETVGEARIAAVKAMEAMEAGQNSLAKTAVEKLMKDNADPTLSGRLAALTWKFSDLQNLSLGATATSTTGLSPDGQGGPAPNAIDGNSQTYWDEVDNQKLYALKVQLKRRAKVMLLRIQGWQHQNYAPKDFEVLCDGKRALQVQSAEYRNNWLTVGLNGVECQTLELKIEGYYGSSPAIRELEIRGQFLP